MLKLNNGLSVIGNYVNEDDRQITLRIHCNSPYPQVRSYGKEDIKEVKTTTGIKGLYERVLKDLYGGSK
jgi:hypothetical protein